MSQNEKCGGWQSQRNRTDTSEVFYRTQVISFPRSGSLLTRHNQSSSRLLTYLTPDISMTAHSGVLRAVFKNLHVPLHRLATGDMNVLVVRVRTCYEQ